MTTSSGGRLCESTDAAVEAIQRSALYAGMTTLIVGCEGWLPLAKEFDDAAT